jgi:hypothetical protein
MSRKIEPCFPVPKSCLEFSLRPETKPFADVVSGMYGDLGSIGPGNAYMIIAQLFLTLVELLRTGYGLG